jgi:hypothetical protein
MANVGRNLLVLGGSSFGFAARVTRTITVADDGNNAG